VDLTDGAFVDLTDGAFVDLTLGAFVDLTDAAFIDLGERYRSFPFISTFSITCAATTRKTHE
jgi:hypothetical protein